MITRLLRSLVICAALLATATAAGAAEIKMIASNAVREAYLQLVPAFEKTSGHKVTIDWGGTADIMKQIRGGEVADIVIVPAPAIDALIKEGKLAGGSRVDVAKSAIGAAVRAGAVKPDISSGDALKRTLLAARSIIISSGPSGVYLAELFRKIGIADQIKAKTTQLPPGGSPGEAVARGEGEIGFTQVSELLAVKGIDYLGPLSPDVQQVTTFSAGLHRAAPAPEAAKALLKFLTGPDARAAVKKSGLEPG